MILMDNWIYKYMDRVVLGKGPSCLRMGPSCVLGRAVLGPSCLSTICHQRNVLVILRVR